MRRPGSAVVIFASPNTLAHSLPVIVAAFGAIVLIFSDNLAGLLAEADK